MYALFLVAVVITDPQKRRGGPASAVGPLFAKPLAYDVTYKPAANSSVVLTLDVPGETTKASKAKVEL